MADQHGKRGDDADQIEIIIFPLSKTGQLHLIIFNTKNLAKNRIEWTLSLRVRPKNTTLSDEKRDIKIKFLSPRSKNFFTIDQNALSTRIFLRARSKWRVRKFNYFLELIYQDKKTKMSKNFTVGKLEITKHLIYNNIYFWHVYCFPYGNKQIDKPQY